MMASWKMKLQKASFRGAEFGVTTAQDAVGRQTVTHIFPQADAPYVEDLGAAPRSIQLTAFVLGSDYMSKRDKLQKALDEKGAGTLIHPWYGSLFVVLTKASISHSADDGGMAVFSLEFMRVQKPDMPKAGIDSKGLATKRSALASSLSGSVLQAALHLRDYGEYVLQEAHTAVTSALDAITETLGVNPLEVADWVQDVYADASALYDMVVTKAAFGQAFVALLGGMADMLPQSSADKAGQNPAPLFALAASVQAVPQPEQAGISRQTVAANAQAVAQAVRQAASIEALRLSASYIPATRGEVMTLRGQIIDAVQAAQQECTDDNLFAALADAQAAALHALAENAGQVPNVVSIALPQTHNALALAYRWTGNAHNATDLVRRNGIRHPAFVRGGQHVEVLL